MTKKSFDNKIAKFDLGHFFKEIRRNRGYTLKDAGGDYISKSQLSRFENNGTTLTAEKLYFAITQISMTPNDFFNAFNDYKFDRMQKLYFTLDNIQLSLQEGLEKSEKLIIKHPDSKFEKLSNVMIKSVSVSGVTHSVESEILTASGIDDSDYFFSLLFNHRLFEENVIKNDSWIKSASLTYQFPNKFILKVNEYNIIAYTQTDGGYQPILENGTRKEVVDASQLPETFLTINLTDEKAIQKLIKAFSKLDENLVSQIQTVSSAESTTTSDLLLLNMHDGNTIRVPLSEIAEKLPYYTQIKGNIAEGSIVDMEVGIYATTEAIESEAAAEKESTEESIASDATDDTTTETDNSTVEVSPTNEIYNPVEGVAEDFTISQ